jgi:7,8-dihydroneopterin aldolase/epimerase/oxygenase
VRNLDTMMTTDVGGNAVGELAGNQPRARAHPCRRVFLRGLELIGSIGIYEHERRYRQRVIVSVDLLVDDHYDGISDDITAVYDYDHAISAIKRLVDSRHYNLIETLAEAIATACLAGPGVAQVTVAIEKPDVLPACRAVGIEIERSRSS